MPFASKEISEVITGLTVGMLAGLTGSCQVEIQMRDSRKGSFSGLRALQYRDLSLLVTGAATRWFGHHRFLAFD